MQRLDVADQLTFCNGLQDMANFSYYAIQSEKYSASQAQLIGLLNSATIEEELKILKALLVISQAALKNYAIKTEYENRVTSLYANEAYGKALNGFFDDLKEFIETQVTEQSSVLFPQLESTRTKLVAFIEKLQVTENEILTKELIAKSKYEDQLLPHYYEALKTIGDGIYVLTVRAAEVQGILNQAVLFYIDVIINNINQ
jgi:seryl-tRNA(Sec) selenium transferase